MGEANTSQRVNRLLEIWRFAGRRNTGWWDEDVEYQSEAPVVVTTKLYTGIKSKATERIPDDESDPLYKKM